MALSFELIQLMEYSEFQQWLLLAGVCLLGAMSPGPSLAVVLKSRVQGELRNGISTSLGHGLGVGIYALLSITGLALILTQTQWLFKLVQLAGAVYLLWLGYKAIRSHSNAFTLEPGAQSTQSNRQSFVTGFNISFLNPKIAVFFIALFSQFVDPDSSVLVKGIYALTASAIDALWYMFIAATVSVPAILSFLKRYAIGLDRLFGILLIAVALTLITDLV